MADQRQLIGQSGESIAANFLEEKGFKIIKRNYKNKLGEVDLIGRIGSEFVFIEVKTRSGDQFGFPEESVTRPKVEKIIKVAQSYLHETKNDNQPYRIDVVAIRTNTDPLEIKHLESVDIY